jgi:hypothetical protein
VLQAEATGRHCPAEGELIREELLHGALLPLRQIEEERSRICGSKLRAVGAALLGCVSGQAAAVEEPTQRFHRRD